MGLPAEKPCFNRADYLIWEHDQPERHEYVAGEVFAMVGVRDRRNVIALNLAALVRPHLKGSPCKTYLSDIKLEVSAADSVFYPDLFVTCETPSDPLVKRDAALIVEILSPSTEAYDRGRKFGMYRLLPGLKEYLLIGTDEALVEVYRRTDDDAWLLRTYRPGDTFTLTSIDLQIAVDDVFDEIDFSSASDTV